MQVTRTLPHQASCFRAVCAHSVLVNINAVVMWFYPTGSNLICGPCLRRVQTGRKWNRLFSERITHTLRHNMTQSHWLWGSVRCDVASSWRLLQSHAALTCCTRPSGSSVIKDPVFTDCSWHYKLQYEACCPSLTSFCFVFRKPHGHTTHCSL